MIWWDAALIATAAAAVLAILAAALKRDWLALPAVPVLLGALALRVVGVPLPQADRFAPLLTLALVALATAGGGPLVAFMFTVISLRDKKHGKKGERPEREVLRGGAPIGYLERFAVIGAVLVGQPAAVAIIVAVKGLGRFTELDSAAARERFIVGTLGSLIWAATCATVIAGTWS